MNDSYFIFNITSTKIPNDVKEKWDDIIMSFGKKATTKAETGYVSAFVLYREYGRICRDLGMTTILTYDIFVKMINTVMQKQQNAAYDAFLGGWWGVKLCITYVEDGEIHRKVPHKQHSYSIKCEPNHTVVVDGYYRKNGVYVTSHTRTYNKQ